MDTELNLQKTFRMRQDIANTAKKAYSKETMIRKYMDEYDRNGIKERILLIDVNCKSSSTGKIVYDLYDGLRKNGRNVSICYGRGPLVEGENIYKFGLDWETRIHAGLARITGYNGCFSPKSTKRLLEYIELYRPEIIHIHELHAYFVNIKPLLEYVKRKKIPLLWTFHCEYMYTGKCGHAYECTKYQNECGHCPAIKEYPKSLLLDKTKQMLQMKKELLKDLDFTIITPSKWLADRVTTSFLKEKRITVIHNGIDTDLFCPTDASGLKKELGIPYNNRVILAVAPNIMSDAKGGKWVIQLAKMMSNEKMTFVLIGSGRSPTEIPNNVLFIGEVRNQRLLAQYYSMADVFVLFSQRETYSMTCAEALCCGTPVVGFKCGAPETVFTGPDAKFFGYGEVGKIRKVIK